MIVHQLTVGQLQTNCYLAACETTREGVIIDPGAEPERILAAVRDADLQIRYILNTHAHFDHIGANEAIQQTMSVPIALHPDDLPLLRNAGGAAAFGLYADVSPEPTMLLSEGQKIEVGTLSFEVLLTPGHTIGHVSFHESAERVVFDGDVLFDGGIGRTDIPGGDSVSLMRSITDVLFRLTPETVVYPGHGGPTTIGREQKSNPWV